MPTSEAVEKLVGKQWLTKNGYISKSGEFVPKMLEVCSPDVFLFQLLRITELSIRNTICVNLQNWATDKDPDKFWWDLIPCSEGAKKKIAIAKRRTPDKILDSLSIPHELSLSFWTQLFAGYHEHKVWIPTLQGAFPHCTPKDFERRRFIEAHLRKVTNARNRVAHHKPMTPEDIHRLERICIKILSWIDPGSANWAANYYRIS